MTYCGICHTSFRTLPPPIPKPANPGDVAVVAMGGEIYAKVIPTLRGEAGPELFVPTDAGRNVAGGTRYDPPPAPRPRFCDARHPTTGHVCVRGDHDDHWHYTANHRGWGDPDDDPTL
jgi:hypothetical protein